MLRLSSGQTSLEQRTIAHTYYYSYHICETSQIAGEKIQIYGAHPHALDAVLQTYPIGRIGDPLQFCLLCLGVQ